MGVLKHSCLAVEHYYTEASLEVLEHEAAAVESEFAIVAAGLEKGLHLPEVSEPQGPLVGLETKGVEKTFGNSK